VSQSSDEQGRQALAEGGSQPGSGGRALLDWSAMEEQQLGPASHAVEIGADRGADHPWPE